MVNVISNERVPVQTVFEMKNYLWEVGNSIAQNIPFCHAVPSRCSFYCILETTFLFKFLCQ